MMELHADFTKSVVLHGPELPWTPSPMPGVHRRMLDRIGDEVARATTIVRYAPQSAFSPHVHGGGEEFIVLEGVFQDEHGDYPVGTYVRNPPTSKHTPRSEPGCIIFVKLWQFDPHDRTQVTIRMAEQPRKAHPTLDGVEHAVLFEDQRECVEYQCWDADAHGVLDVPGGAEILVLEGELQTPNGTLAAQSWSRMPPGGRFSASAREGGATLWIKTGHLTDVSSVDVELNLHRLLDP